MILCITGRLTILKHGASHAGEPFGRRSILAYLGRHVRATESTASSSLHYAFSGVSSPAPPLQGRIGLFRRRAAPPHRPVRASPSSRTSSWVLHVLQASPCPGAAAGHCLWPSLRQGELHLRFGNDYMYSGTGATTTSSRSPFSWLLRSSQGPFLSPIEFGSASSNVLRQCERDRCPKGSGPLVQLTKDIPWPFPPSETLWCALVQATVWLCFRPWLFW